MCMEDPVKCFFTMKHKHVCKSEFRQRLAVVLLCLLFFKESYLVFCSFFAHVRKILYSNNKIIVENDIASYHL